MADKTCAIWAEVASDIPSSVEEDARLRDRDGGFWDSDKLSSAQAKWKYPDGPAYGQAGWDWGIRYASFRHLEETLEGEMPSFLQDRFGVKSLPKESVHRLAIHAHGLPGEIAIQGMKDNDGKPKTLMTADNLTEFQFSYHLSNLNYYLKIDATILFMGCLAGKGPNGTRLLRGLATESFPGRKIVLFVTLGYDFPKEQHGNPGMRDTDHAMPGGPQWDWYGQYYDKLDKLPWASESSPHARVYQANATNPWIRGEALESYEPA